MHNDTPIPEQEQVKQVVKLWRKNSVLQKAVTLVSFILLFYFLFLCPVSFILQYRWVIAFSVLGILSVMSYSITQVFRKRFMKQLSPQEHTVFLQMLTTKADNSDLHLQDMQRNFKTIKPKREYLRASTEPQDETLLRAAASTDTTPKDQLLRPSTTKHE